MQSLKDKVAIVGVGCTKFGERFDTGFSDLLIESVKEACEDAGVAPRDLEAAWLGSFRPWFAGERNTGSPLAEAMGLVNKPITLVSNICATGMDALRNACLGVASGVYDLVLAVGVEKMRDLGSRSLSETNRSEGHPFLGKGRTAPGFFAMCANRYMHTYGVQREVLAQVAVKNHRHGAKNPKAHFQREITLEQVLKAPMVAEPLGVLDCCPTTDGSAAAIVTRPEIARRMRSDYILVKGIGLAVSTERNIFDPDYDFLGFPPTKAAGQSAYDQAGIRNPREELDLAIVHDCFSITEILIYEDLQFAPRGEGWRLITEGVTTMEGDLPVNTDGGLKSFGHPIGASGLRMVYEVTKQLQGKAGERQVKGAELALAHNLGGPGALACVGIFGTA